MEHVQARVLLSRDRGGGGGAREQVEFQASVDN